VKAAQQTPGATLAAARVTVIAFTCLAPAGSDAAPAQAREPAAGSYPQRPVRLIVAQSPGGNADIIGRALG